MAVAGLVALVSAGTGLACVPDADAQRMHTERAQAPAVYVSTGTIPVARPFDASLLVCDADAGTGIAVDAVMPAHRHGMNYDPVIKDLGAGRFSVSGLVFHMPGDWQLRVTVTGLEPGESYTLDLIAR